MSLLTPKDDIRSTGVARRRSYLVFCAFQPAKRRRIVGVPVDKCEDICRSARLVLAEGLVELGLDDVVNSEQRFHCDLKEKL